MNKIAIYLLPKINFMCLKKNNTKHIYIYSNQWFIQTNINNYEVTYKKSLHILELSTKQPFYKSKAISTLLNNLLFSWETFFFKKISFTGKGFKIKKKQKIIFFFFNKSHISLLICNSAVIKKINKQKILFFFKNYSLYEKILSKILKIRYANIYTKRGLRFSRQLILKRKGKGGVQPQ